MAGAGRKWLWSCGLGCGAVVMLSIAIAVSGAFWVRGMLRGFGEAIEAGQALERRFGQGGEFVPWPDGAIPADRMEVFLRVHAAPDEYRERIASFFRLLPVDPDEAERLESGSLFEKLRFVFDVSRGGVGLATHISGFLRARNEALNEAGMGLGEYTYIYVTAYYAWLGHSPADEPTSPSTTVGIERDGPAAGERAPDEPPGPGPWQTPRARRDFLAQLRNLQDSLDAAEQDAATRAWAARLSAEIEALDDDPHRIPWEDGVPDAIRASLEPYRERVEDGYSAATNPFELARGEKRGLSIQAD